MYEIYSVFGQPFQRSQLIRERVGAAPKRRRGKALFLILGILASLVVAGGIGYRTGVLKLPDVLAKANITLPFR